MLDIKFDETIYGSAQETLKKFLIMASHLSDNAEFNLGCHRLIRDAYDKDWCPDGYYLDDKHELQAHSSRVAYIWRSKLYISDVVSRKNDSIEVKHKDRMLLLRNGDYMEVNEC
ncbi:MAG: hypothetical protein Ta2D_13620 [Rickettsiales bacterium]|nr:MAG: hypothetical protein Ta2D_13620 [Rickettsiales bacterium]